MKKWWGGGILLLSALALFMGAVYARGGSFSQGTFPSSFKVPAPEKPISLVFVGDIMLDRGVLRSVSYNFYGNFSELFTHTPYIRDADIAFGNLEGPAATSGHNVGSKYSFRMDPSIPSVLKNAGFDVVSFANNHVGDYTRAAFDETRERLTEAGIVYAGAGANRTDARTVRIVSRGGMKIGFLAASDVGPAWMEATDTDSGIVLADAPDLSLVVEQAKAAVDVLVVSFHWGEEYKEANQRQELLAQKVIDAGADIVVGHHPHVVQRVDSYKGKPIFYSLGNFIFDQSFSKETMEGMVAQVFISEDKTIRVETNTVHLDTRFQPQEVVPGESTAVPMLSDEELLSKNDCPKPTKESGVDLLLLSIPTPYSLRGYIPNDLVPVGTKTTGESWCLKKDAAIALGKMNAALRAEGLGLTVTTGYRAEADQNEMKTAFDRAGKTAYVAEVGSSEHQLGTAADFGAVSGGSFGNSKEYRWLKAHGAAYGFVESYQAGKTSENGYPPEPWHWRYVGTGAAQKITASGEAVNTYLKSMGD